ncbi:g281 [Coccomyxa elongata]
MRPGRAAPGGLRCLATRAGGCTRCRSTAPSAAACAQPVLQGQPPAPATGGLHCMPPGAAASGAPPARSLCYRGSTRRLLQEACAACLVRPLQEHSTQRCRRRAACATGAPTGACYRRLTLPCHSRPAGAAASGAPHQHCRLRAACATGVAQGACYRRPALPAAWCGRYRSTAPSAAARAQPVLQGHPPAPATGGSVPLQELDRCRLRPALPFPLPFR